VGLPTPSGKKKFGKKCLRGRRTWANSLAIMKGTTRKRIAMKLPFHELLGSS
jgi:hypothetical protein